MLMFLHWMAKRLGVDKKEKEENVNDRTGV